MEPKKKEIKTSKNLGNTSGLEIQYYSLIAD